MTQDFLKTIVEHKKVLNAAKKELFARLQDKLATTQYTRYGIFQKAIAKPGKINLIAEVKKASPSKGLLREDFDLLSIVRSYEENGACAISVLTEEKFFLGKPEYIKKIAEEIKLPLLAKDFMIEPGQLFEAKFNGASAVLLIVTILTPQELKNLIATAEQLDLDCLVEVHDEKELEIALKAGAFIIGINNRNLRSFDVDLGTSEKLIPRIPKTKIIVVESGIDTHEHIVKFQGLGAHAVLIGETFMKTPDISGKIKELMHGKS